MERYDRDPSTFIEELYRLFKRTFKHTEFVIHCNAQCLENTFGRMPTRSSELMRNLRFDYFSQLCGRLNRSFSPPAFYFSRNLFGELLLSVSEKYADELFI